VFFFFVVVFLVVVEREFTRKKISLLFTLLLLNLFVAMADIQAQSLQTL